MYVSCPYCGKNVKYEATRCHHCKALLNFSNPSGIPTCPKCGSQSVQLMKKGFGLGKAAAGVIAAGPVGALAGFIGSNSMERVCCNCGNKW